MKAILIDKDYHLEMFDSNNPDCIAIDGLLTTVKSGFRIEWIRAEESNIDSIENVYTMMEPNIFKDIRVEGDSITLEVPPVEKEVIIKYYVRFIVDGNSYEIDPYLRIED